MNLDSAGNGPPAGESSINRRHDMPFGATVLDEGKVRFGLWAPAAERVDVCLRSGADDDVIPMQAAEEGWFNLTTDAASSGKRYRFRIDGNLEVPDPASRFQPDDVHGHSQVMDALAWRWLDTEWRGRPWHEAVICELHVGAFTPDGTFKGVKSRLADLEQLGVTAIELMPLADFPGVRNWGYDGTLLFAPDSSYGTPGHLKDLVQSAHAHGIMVLLDVVYNHFGPEGNYLNYYAPQFFSTRHHTPWGVAINLDGPDSRWVRQFYLHNALYWLEEFHFDGLRLDAVHALRDDSSPDFMTELATGVQRHFGDTRHIHLILENDNNAARYLGRNSAGNPDLYTAQWNEDMHHALHVLLTDEDQGYYSDYAGDPRQHLGRALAEGFSWQGESSPYREGRPRGEPSAHLPPTAFVSFLQNHDQIGNRALGERMHTLTTPQRLRSALAVQLLAPSPPLMFMGDDWAASSYFPFFCDFGGELAEKVTEGRRREFSRFPQFRDPAAARRIPDPSDPETFLHARLDWNEKNRKVHREWSIFYQQLLDLRHREIVPLLRNVQGGIGTWERPSPTLLLVSWRLDHGARLILLFNACGNGTDGVPYPVDVPLLHATPLLDENELAARTMPAWCAAWFLDRGESSA